MTQLTLSAAPTGLNNVGLTKALQSEAKLSLGDAKRITDRVVEGEKVRLRLDDDDMSTRFASAAAALNAVAEVDSPSTVRPLAG